MAAVMAMGSCCKRRRVCIFLHAPVAFFAVIIRIISKTSASKLTVPISATMAAVTVW